MDRASRIDDPVFLAYPRDRMNRFLSLCILPLLYHQALSLVSKELYRHEARHSHQDTDVRVDRAPIYYVTRTEARDRSAQDGCSSTPSSRQISSNELFYLFIDRTVASLPYMSKYCWLLRCPMREAIQCVVPGRRHRPKCSTGTLRNNQSQNVRSER